MRVFSSIIAVVLSMTAVGCGDDGGGGGVDTGVTPPRDSGTPPPRPDGGSSTGGERNPVCEVGTSAGEVAAPEHLMNLRGQTSWFASPIVADLDGDGVNELIAAYYDVFVFDDAGELLDEASFGDGRIYAPHVVADLEGDGIVEVVYGRGQEVWALEWRDGAFQQKSGWPQDTTTAGNSSEVRGLVAGDLDNDGLLEIIATTTQTERSENGGAQVFVYSVNGALYQPADASFPAWPRYNDRTGAGGDMDRNGQGHNGFGCYGLNVGIGNIDDDADLEILATYDNHHIQAFDKNGEAIDAAPYFTNRQTDYSGMPLTWGQFIRWADPAVEDAHYNRHEGEWPHPRAQEWLQWTASPPNVVDLDGDGQNEVLGIPNIEMNEPYETQAYGILVLEGAHGDGSRSAMRLPGWETMPRGEAPIQVDGWYPPGGVPAALTLDVQGDNAPEIIVSLNDGFVYAFGADATRLWRFDFTHGETIMYSSEVVAADLNQDGSPELVFTTFGSPDVVSGYLMILGADGTLLHDIPLPDPGDNGNGNGSPAAPGIYDLDGDGQLEIIVQTFDHGMDVFTVPGSGTACTPWPTARGGPLRMGQPNGG
ncbi:MAG: hypothetical protein DRJ42_02445 [Deltaproteobacteria bacterium]|nr:MAG: hypothetical protein DRJ42_02445 [Deltaproteobacteria bacterium]